ncbi:hypothetical protein VRRI112168_00060 [Vreelandella rituensis]|uniref:Lipoprotein n=1 Tax=Vreelandella rituensis TaxID=2282306 RepID=A0A368U9K5_9GAMM|nr:hypothetical protein [Halomonas rituensis]RCV93908.1 hypothetical protein DU506_01745 [Halomonas rituensis]
MKKTLISLAVALAIPLSACGTDPVETVKNAPVQSQEELTYSSLLDNRTFCTNPQWAEREPLDTQNNPAVELRCTLLNGLDFMEKEKEARIAYKRKRPDQHIEKLRFNLENNPANLAYLREMLAKRVATNNSYGVDDLKQQIESAIGAPERIEKKIQEAEADLAKMIQTIEENYNYTRVEEVYKWTVTDRVTLNSVGIAGTHASGEEGFKEYALPLKLFEIIKAQEIEGDAEDKDEFHYFTLLTENGVM